MFKALKAKVKINKLNLTEIKEQEAEEVSSGSDEEKNSDNFVLTLSGIISSRKN